MPQPTRGDIHVNRPLSNMSIAYLQNEADYIATKVFPNIPVSKQSDRYFSYNKGDWFRTDAKVRGISQESAGSGYEIDNTPNYFCNVQALHKDVDDQLRANQDDPINLDREATMFVTNGMALRRELDWAAKYFTTGVWTGSSTGTDIVPSTLWDASSSTPISDIRTQIGAMKKNTGKKANKLVLAEDVWLKLQDNADFLDRITITKDKIVTTALLAALLDLEEVLIAGAVRNTAVEGATTAMNWINTKDALLVHAPKNPGIMTASAGYTFSWKGYLGASAQGTRIKKFRMEHLNSDRVEAEIAYDQKVVAADLGVFFNNTIS
jgi:hypothetical protein